MRRNLFGAAVALVALIGSVSPAHAQKMLDTKTWGSLSGKVTLTSAPSALAMSGGKVMMRL